MRYGTLVDTRLAPGNINVSKMVLRMVDLLTTGQGTEVNVGQAGDLYLRADFPVDVMIGDSGVVRQSLTELRLSGNITHLRIRRLSTLFVGRVVLYLGYPTLGLGFRPELPEYMGRYKSQPFPMPAVWGAGLTQFDFHTFAIPPGLGVTAMEAYYLWDMLLQRNSGYIDRVEYIESEGLGNPIWAHGEKDPTERLMFRANVPVRLSTAGTWRVHGSAEAVDTTLNVAEFFITIV